MESRKLGRQGLEVSAIGYGAMGTAAGYGPSDDTESIAAIRTAHELGVTLFDTAEMYGWGTGEQLLGTALAPIRDDVVIATKFGLTPEGGMNSRPDHIREVVENSLRNLNVDTIDVLYQHRSDPDVPIEDVVGVMQGFVQAGKVKYLGLSEADGETIRRAHAVHPISVLQSEYSIFAHDAEPVLPVIEELGIGLVAYSPLARGFLAAPPKPRTEYAADDFRQYLGWWAPANFDANAALSNELRAFAAEKGTTLSKLALAWLLAKRDYIVPIPGSRNPARVADNIAAWDLHLSTTDLARIDAIAPNGAVGSRNYG